MKPPRFALPLALLAGGLDFCTGLGLALVPELTLRLMLAPPPAAAALLYLRFVGGFVWAVGAGYLWASSAPVERLRVTLAVTIFPRLAAGSFTGIAVALGALPWPWLSVTATDFTLVAAQLWLLRHWDQTA